MLLAPVLTEGKKLVKTPTWYVFHMYKAHMDATLLHSTVATSSVSFEDSLKVQAITSSASKKDGVYTVTLSNADLDKTHTVSVTLANLEGKINSVSAKVLAADEMNTINTFDCPDKIVEKDLAAKVNGDEILLEVPARV